MNTSHINNTENVFDLWERQSLMFRRLTERPVSPVPQKELNMAYVIAQPCIGVKDAACVSVCPVDCIHPSSGDAGFDASEQLFIDPQLCTDCGLCIHECPVAAIFAEE